MCIHFNPRINEIAEEELDAADQAAVDHEEESDEEEYVSDVESEYEVKGLRGINHFMNVSGEDEVLEENWRHLCVIQKLVVFDILLNLDLETEMEDISEKGKEAVAHIRAIVEGRGDERLMTDGKVVHNVSSEKNISCQEE